MVPNWSRVWKLPRTPVTDVEKPVQTHRTDIDVFSPEDVMALVRRGVRT